MSPDMKVAVFAIAVMLVGLSLAPAPADVGRLAQETADSIELPSATTPRPHHAVQPWQQVSVSKGDSLSGIFAAAGLAPGTWKTVVALGASAKPLRHLQPGDKLFIRQSPQGTLQALAYQGSASTPRIIVTRENGALRARTGDSQIQIHKRTLTGHVEGTLAGSLQKAGLSQALAHRVADIFSWRIHLHRSVHAGDPFTIIYRQRNLGGHPLPGGTLLAAQLQAGSQTLRAFRFKNAAGKVHYYDIQGRPYMLSIERTPLHYAYVSSTFSRHRMNPVLHKIMPHLGVDLAATKGTPVHAAADGQVVFMGRDGGYGRLIKLDHAHDYQTRYAHLSAYAKGLHDGEYVHQGEVIGYVGATGRATGPHLHFEIRHDGIAHNPLHMQLPNGQNLTGVSLARFDRQIGPRVARLGAHWPAPLRGKLAMRPAVIGQCRFSSVPSRPVTSGYAHRTDGVNRLLCPAS